MTRFIGRGARPRIPPRGEAWSEDGAAIVVRVADESMAEIPDAATLDPETSVIVLPETDRPGGILSAFGRHSLSRHARCEALLARGYVDIGAEIDPPSRIDIVFGRAPRRAE